MNRAHALVVRILVLTTAVAAGCAVDVTMQSDSPVQVGDQVTYDITVTNRTSCPLPAVGFNLLPLLDEQEQEAATGEILDQFGITLQDLCTAAQTGVPPILNPTAVKDERTTAFLQPANGTPIVSQAATCMEVVDGSTGLTVIQCGVGELAPGASEMASLMVTADSAGTFLNVTASLTRPAGICRGGNDSGQPCRNNMECDSDVCANGFCDGGGTPGDGCNDNADCGAGSCTLCARCQQAGLCTGSSDEPGAACFEDDDCPNGGCLCGATIVCSETTVLEPQPDGSECSENLECDSRICADGVCCETVCGPMQACNIQGSEGMCADLGAAAPAVSGRGLVIAILLLSAAGGLGIWRLRPRKRRIPRRF